MSWLAGAHSCRHRHSVHQQGLGSVGILKKRQPETLSARTAHGQRPSPRHSMAPLRAECLNEHWFLSRSDARSKVDAWRRHYNGDRPHSARGYLAPTSTPGGIRCVQRPGGYNRMSSETCSRIGLEMGADATPFLLSTKPDPLHRLVEGNRVDWLIYSTALCCEPVHCWWRRVALCNCE